MNEEHDENEADCDASPPSFADEEDMGVPPPPPPPDPNGHTASPLRPLGAMLDDALDRADKRARGEEKPIPLPWPELEEQFGGGLWSGLHVLVAGSAIGKTTWSLQGALHAATHGYPVVYIGLELDEMQIALRLIGDRAGVAWSKLYIGKAKDEQRARARSAADSLRDLPFYGVQGSPSGWAANELYELVDDARAKHPGKPLLVVLDFLQIVGDEHDPMGHAARLDLRERIGRAAYVGRDVARTRNASVVLISSAGRDKYDTLRNLVDSAGLGHVEKKTRYGGSAGFRRTIACPDAIIGLGKESGEIEYAADTVTVAARFPKELDGETSVLFATAKNRYGRPSWSELRFNGFRFASPKDEGDTMRAELRAAKERREKHKAEKKAEKEAAANGEKKNGADSPSNTQSDPEWKV
jgi:replicative DNA helicase